MPERSDEERRALRQKIIGMGERSMRKSYFPELREKLDSIQQLNVTLEQRVADRTEELQKANQRLIEEITEREHADQELHDAQKMLEQRVLEATSELRAINESVLREKAFTEAVLDSVPGLLYMYDAEGFLVRWNKKHEEITGYTAEELANRHVLDWYKDSERDQNVIREGVARALTEGSADAEAELITKEGRRIPFYFTAVRLEIDGKVYFAGIGIDLSQRRAAEAALRRSELDLRAFVENCPFGIHRSSISKDCFLSANPALVQLLGYENAAEVLVLKLSRDIYVDPTERERLLEGIPENTRFSGIEAHWKKKDGNPVTVRLSGRRFCESGESLIECITVDLTGQLRLEEQFRQAQKMEAVGRLAGGIAHDFNNLLGVILGYSETLEDALAGDSVLRRKAEQIRKAGERAALLTSQLLAFSRRQVLHPRIVNMNSLISETEGMLQRLIGEDIEMHTVLGPTIPQVRIDPGQMVQVIMNLVVNARDAMPKGGSLVIATTQKVITKEHSEEGSFPPPGAYVTLIVSDTGEGMDETTKARLFEPFFTTKPAGRGTGLGLATVYGIVKQSGGYITAESEIGKGTSFKIFLPSAAQELSDQEIPPTSEPDPRGAETVLIVEDSSDLRELICQILETRGYLTLPAASGAEGLEIARSHPGPIHLLLTDVILPLMSGPELAEQMRLVRKEASIVFMSGYPNEQLATHNVLGESIELLRKPFKAAELLSKVRAVIDRR